MAAGSGPDRGYHRSGRSPRRSLFNGRPPGEDSVVIEPFHAIDNGGDGQIIHHAEDARRDAIGGNENVSQCLRREYALFQKRLVAKNGTDEFLKVLVCAPAGSMTRSKRRASWTSPWMASRASMTPKQITEALRSLLMNRSVFSIVRCSRYEPESTLWISSITSLRTLDERRRLRADRSRSEMGPPGLCGAPSASRVWA